MVVECDPTLAVVRENIFFKQFILTTDRQNGLVTVLCICHRGRLSRLCDVRIAHAY